VSVSTTTLIDHGASVLTNMTLDQRLCHSSGASQTKIQPLNENESQSVRLPTEALQNSGIIEDDW